MCDTITAHIRETKLITWMPQTTFRVTECKLQGSKTNRLLAICRLAYLQYIQNMAIKRRYYKDWLQKGIRFGFTKFNNRKSKIILDILQIDKYYHDSYGILESRFDSRRRKPSRRENPKRHLLGWPFSLLLFIIAIMPFNYILRKSSVGYTFTKSHEIVNHFMYWDDIKAFAKNENNWRHW